MTGYYSGWRAFPLSPPRSAATTATNSTGATRPALKSLRRVAASLCILGLVSLSWLLLLLRMEQDLSPINIVTKTVKMVIGNVTWLGEEIDTYL